MIRLLAALFLTLAAPAAADTLSRQIATLEAATERYRDIRVARAEGWRRATGHVNLMGEHWVPGDNDPDYRRGDDLDFARPSNLLYAEIDGRMELVSAAFVVRIGPGDPHPDGFAGFQDLWHVHNVDEVLAAQCEVRPFLSALGEWWVERNMAPDGLRRLAMVHVWLESGNPLGRFANFDPRLPYRRLGLDPRTWQGDLDAARGLALAHPDGCANDLDGDLFLADVPRATARGLRRSCRNVARQIRARLGASPAERDAFAAAAWRAWTDRRVERLTPAERARIAAIVEGDADLPTMQ
ncbi:MAG: hypothetical protein AAF390_09750 [Pseudomonadota bacterium]